MTSNWKPNKWLALVLGFFGGPIGIAYTAGPLLGAVAFAAFIAVTFSLIFLAGANLGVLALTSAIIFASLSLLLARIVPARASKPAYARWYDCWPSRAPTFC